MEIPRVFPGNISQYGRWLDDHTEGLNVDPIETLKHTAACGELKPVFVHMRIFQCLVKGQYWQFVG